ncbi:MAG: M3 family oligoendopeptidase, partial [Oscillospiraceae bacterium]|nr:M3 family oligoendopeptidase [Oscillospiraceae bacterium]
MKVCDLPYRRVSEEEIREGIGKVLSRIREAKSADEILQAREEYLALLLEYQTNSALAYMRYSVNTVDEFYVAENAYYDEIGPMVQNAGVQYAAALLDSPFREELEEKLSPVLFQSMEVERKAVSEAILEDMVEENRLIRQYSDLMSGMEFSFRGETLPRAMLMKYARSEDRAVRRECYAVLGRGLESHRQELDGIFDRLVHVRDRMAKKMG